MIKRLTIGSLAAAGILLTHPIEHKLAAQDRTRPHRTPAATPAQTLPKARVRMVIRAGVRHIYANGIPDHPTGQFPNRGNPNTIAAQQYHFTMPLKPGVSSSPPPVGLAFFGIANNGIPFEAGTAEWWQGDRHSGWHIEANTGFADFGLDMNHAHVQRNGAYHYHGIPTAWLEARHRQPGVQPPHHLGWAADGYPIYAQLGYSDPMNPKSKLKPLQPSYQLKPGTRPGAPSGPGGRFNGRYEEDFIYVTGSGDLDKFNGRFGRTPEFPQGTYYYVVTETFPNVSRYWKGVPDKSFKNKGGSGRRGPGRPPRRRGGRGGRQAPDHSASISPSVIQARHAADKGSGSKADGSEKQSQVQALQNALAKWVAFNQRDTSLWPQPRTCPQRKAPGKWEVPKAGKAAGKSETRRKTLASRVLVPVFARDAAEIGRLNQGEETHRSIGSSSSRDFSSPPMRDRAGH